MSPSIADPATLRWVVCHTKPRCEKKLASSLTTDGVEHYLPLIKSVYRYRSKTETYFKPLFPSYVFARVCPENRNSLYRQELLVRAIPVDNETTFLGQLDQVRTVIASGLAATLHPLLKRGTHVRIAAGPLMGVRGVVDNPSNPTGVVVAIDVLRQGLLIRLPIEILEIQT